jgi:hypothetical protein
VLIYILRRWYDAKWQVYESSQRPQNAFWDAGHPISIKKQVLRHLLQFYEPIYEREFHFETPFYEGDEGIYFIGRKR